MRYILKSFLAIIFPLLALVACKKQPPEELGPCAHPVSGDTALPLASITFPWKVSLIERNNIIVRGTAQDVSGIKSVTVNGVAATLSCPGSEVTWQADLTLPDNSDTDIVVAVTDGAGNTAENADQARIMKKQRAPSEFLFDPANNRIFGGLEFFGMPFGYIDLATREATTLADFFPLGFPSAALADSALLTAIALEGVLTVNSTDVNSGVTTELGQLDLELPEGITWATVQSAAYADNALYMLVRYFAENWEDNQTHIIKYALGGGFSTLSSSVNLDQGEPLLSDVMVMGNGQLLVLSSGTTGDSDAIVGVSLVDGFRTSLSDSAGMITGGIAFDSGTNTVYMVGYNGMARLDLDIGGTPVVFSAEEDQDHFNIAQIRSVAFDGANHRLLVGDSDLDMIIAVDTLTGERSKLMGNGIGEGHPLLAPRDFVIDELENRVFVIDDGMNAPEAIFEIDLATGNRTQFSDVDLEFNVSFEDLVLDREHNRLLLAQQQEIFAIDLTSEAVTTFSGGGAPVGAGDPFESVSGMAISPDGQTLLVTDFAAAALLKVDVATGDRSVVSGGVTGEGETLYGPTAVAVDWTNNIAYVTSQELGALFRVDLVTGDREIILSECLDSFGSNSMQSFNLQNIVFDPTASNLWMTSDRNLRYNLSSGVCSVIGDDMRFYLDLGFTASGQLLTSGTNKLMHMDTVTGETVIISK